LEAWRADYFEVVTCPAILTEISEKLHLPRIRKKYPIGDEDVVNLLLRFSQAAYLVPGLARVAPAPPDPKDTMLFAAAIESDADFVVTGDKPLLNFAWPGKARIVSPAQFYREELPQEIVRSLGYPVFLFEDLTATGFLSIEVTGGHSCLALFTTEPAAELHRQKSNRLLELRSCDGPEELLGSLNRASASGCDCVAFNPIEQFCITESIDRVVRAIQEQHGLSE
jgi:putative PIN family toxin of toxin-antitoxin system